jgi:predicted alpha/beta superfamily hydrolase
MIRLIFLKLALFCIICTPAICQVKQDSPLPFRDKDLVYYDYHSKTIGEDYTIYIHLPPGYDTTKTAYPVLYLTDGDWNMTVAMNCFNMLRQDYPTREALLVGIGYGSRTNKRNRDLNPEDGGPKFLTFIKDEVIPFVNAKYRVTTEKGLYGYSFGGVFTTYVLFNQPNFFDQIYIGAPGNNGNQLVPAARSYFSRNTGLKTKVFAGVGSFETQTVKNIGLFKQYLDSIKISGLQIQTAITPNAGHGAALAQVMQNGIKYVYCSYHQPIATPKIAQLQKYTGTYGKDAAPSEAIHIFINNAELYFREGKGDALHLIPFEQDGFFMVENEGLSFRFEMENGVQYLVVNFPTGKDIRLPKTK